MLLTISVFLAVYDVTHTKGYDENQSPAVDVVPDLIETEVLYYDDAENVFWEPSTFEMYLNNREDSPIQFLTQESVESSFKYLQQKKLWTNLTHLDGFATHYKASGHLRMVYSLPATNEEITLTGSAVFYQPSLLITAGHNILQCKCIYKFCFSVVLVNYPCTKCATVNI